MKIKKINLFALILFLFFACSIASVEGGGEGIPEELKDLDVEKAFIPSDGKEVGRILLIKGRGRVVVFHKSLNRAFYASENDPVYEKDVLYTLNDCRCKVAFKNKDSLIMAPNTHLNVEKIDSSILKGEKNSFFSMARGKIIFYAMRLFRFKEVRFGVKTYTATIGVRGTKFGVEIEKMDKQRSLFLHSSVAGTQWYLVQNNPDTGNITTRTYVMEGAIEVTSPLDGNVQRLGPNEILDADMKGLGSVRHDPDATRSFFEGIESGMVSEEQKGPMPKDDLFHREQVERMERINDIRQQEMTPPPVPHEPEIDQNSQTPQPPPTPPHTQTPGVRQ